jgi:hypothetical protein
VIYTLCVVLLPGLLPTVYLLFQVLIDVYRVESTKKTKFGFNSIPVLIIFLFYAFFLSSGIVAFNYLLTEMIGRIYTNILSFFCLLVGYHVAKRLFRLKQGSEDASFEIFMHHFGYMGGAMFVLMFVTFVIMGITS